MRYNGELISKDIIRDIVTNFEYALHAHDPKFKLDKFRKAILDD